MVKAKIITLGKNIWKVGSAGCVPTNPEVHDFKEFECLTFEKKRKYIDLHKKCEEEFNTTNESSIIVEILNFECLEVLEATLREIRERMERESK